MIQDPKTTITGLVLIAVGAYLVIQSHHATPDAIAVLTAGAGLVVAADSKPKA